MDPGKVEILLGPPGTGKTTRLLSIVLAEMERGVPPDRIGYFAFTRKAASEAVERARDRFKLERNDLPYFRTLHSLAFKQLHLRPDQVFGVRHLRELANALRVEVSTWMDLNEGEINWGAKKGDRMFFLENLARVKRRPLKVEWSEAYEDYSFAEVEKVARGLAAYKRDRGLLDYTDMLETWIREGRVPELDVLVVDEAQDLSPIQWDMVDRLAHQAQRIYIAGDDDQAIFRWAGADVEKFIGLEGSAVVLDHSWRCPAPVQSLAGRILQRIRHRRPKDWSPREGDGGVNYVPSFEVLDPSEGSWLILARNAYLLDGAESVLYRNGFLYQRKGKSSGAVAEIEAIILWERLRKGKDVSIEEARKIYAYMTKNHVARGFKTLPMFPDGSRVTLKDLRSRGGLLVTNEWYDALDKIGIENREYLRAVLRRGEKLWDKPRIVLSTIHGAKGGEADNVVLYTDIATRTWLAGTRHPGDEERVFYVGVTRAKNMLHVVDATTNTYFPLA